MGERDASGVGVKVTLREIYDAAMMAARTAEGARGDIGRLRRDVSDVRGRVDAVERQLKDSGTPAYLKRAGYALGLVAAGVAAGWGAVKGG